MCKVTPMRQPYLLYILISTFLNDVACLCVWQVTNASIVQDTEWGGYERNSEHGIHQTNGDSLVECDTLLECKQKCETFGDKCNYFIRSRQTGEAYFFYIEPTAPRAYRDGYVDGYTFDSYDRLCGRAIAFSPKILQFIRDRCRMDEYACQPSAQQLARAIAKRRILERLLYNENPTINTTFDKVRDAKRAFWAWIGFPNMTILDSGLANGDEVLNYEQAQEMENFYKNISSQPVIDYQMPWGRPIDSSASRPNPYRSSLSQATNTHQFPLPQQRPTSDYGRPHRKKRALFVDFENNNRGQKWPSTTIKYKFDRSTRIQTAHVEAARSAINWLKSPKTCLNFVEDQNAMQDAIVFKRGEQGAGCAGNVGKQSGQPNFVIFDDSCATPGHLAHEIMHNLGVRHEHQRPDRDGYISLVLENLDPTMLDESQILANQNFETDLQTVDFNTKYDYSSVMHYPNRAAAKANLPRGLFTILTSDASAQTSIGQRTSVSANDIRAINRAYGCTLDCVYSAWSSYGSCVNGRKTRSRTVLKAATYGGKPCSKQDLTDTAMC